MTARDTTAQRVTPTLPCTPARMCTGESPHPAVRTPAAAAAAPAPCRRNCPGKQCWQQHARGAGAMSRSLAWCLQLPACLLTNLPDCHVSAAPAAASDLLLAAHCRLLPAAACFLPAPLTARHTCLPPAAPLLLPAVELGRETGGWKTSDMPACGTMPWPLESFHGGSALSDRWCWSPAARVRGEAPAAAAVHISGCHGSAPLLAMDPPSAICHLHPSHDCDPHRGSVPWFGTCVVPADLRLRPRAAGGEGGGGGGLASAMPGPSSLPASSLSARLSQPCAARALSRLEARRPP